MARGRIFRFGRKRKQNEEADRIAEARSAAQQGTGSGVVGGLVPETDDDYPAGPRRGTWKQPEQLSSFDELLNAFDEDEEPETETAEARADSSDTTEVDSPESGTPESSTAETSSAEPSTAEELPDPHADLATDPEPPSEPIAPIRVTLPGIEEPRPRGRHAAPEDLSPESLETPEGAPPVEADSPEPARPSIDEPKSAASAVNAQVELPPRPEFESYPDDLPSAGGASEDQTGTVEIEPEEPATHTGPLTPAPAAPSTSELERVETFADLTTMRVGGAPEELRIADSAEELIAIARELQKSGEDWLLLGGGSNTIVADDGYPGAVLLVRNKGIEIIDESADGVLVKAQAGQDFDELVAWSVDNGLAGIEMLSGIPGLAGAAPVQNIGAYGGEIATSLESVEFLDFDTDEVRTLSTEELELGYRTSALKTGDLEGVIVSMTLRLQRFTGEEEPLGMPIAFPQLANTLDAQLGAQLPLQQVRETVLSVRAEKGMVLNPDDHDSWSAGSFFTNPIVNVHVARGLPADAPRWQMRVSGEEPTDTVTPLSDVMLGMPQTTPAQTEEPMVKLSAAWLIEHSGVKRGFRLPGSGAAVSSKHTLAITNRGGASAADVAELARYIVQMVRVEFGVTLHPEPNLYGLSVD